MQLVSEPFDRDGGQWDAIPPGSFVTMTRRSVSIARFSPQPERMAEAV
jgi:predicted glutamine amidotransferase